MNFNGCMTENENQKNKMISKPNFSSGVSVWNLKPCDYERRDTKHVESEKFPQNYKIQQCIFLEVLKAGELLRQEDSLYSGGARFWLWDYLEHSLNLMKIWEVFSLPSNVLHKVLELRNIAWLLPVVCSSAKIEEYVEFVDDLCVSDTITVVNMLREFSLVYLNMMPLHTSTQNGYLFSSLSNFCVLRGVCLRTS